MLTVAQTATAATAADNLTAAKRLNDLLKNTKSMTASFTQTTKGASGGKLSAQNGTFKGTMQVERPSKFRWNITSPSEQLIVANGSTLWIYDKDLEQATSKMLIHKWAIPLPYYCQVTQAKSPKISKSLSQMVIKTIMCCIRSPAMQTSKVYRSALVVANQS